MASSLNGQDKLNPALRLATRWNYLARSGLPAVSRKKKISRKPYNKSFINQAWLLKMAWFWPRLFLKDRDGVLANTQASWPHTWSITHTYFNSCITRWGLTYLYVQLKFVEVESIIDTNVSKAYSDSNFLPFELPSDVKNGCWPYDHLCYFTELIATTVFG